MPPDDILRSLLDLLQVKTAKKILFAIIEIFNILRKGGEIKISEGSDSKTRYCWLDKIKRLHFCTKDKKRNFIIWLPKTIREEQLNKIRFELFFKSEAEIAAVKYSAIGSAGTDEEMSSEGFHTYEIFIKADSDWYEIISERRISGEMCNLNIQRIDMIFGNSKRTFYKCPSTGFFYPFKTLGCYLGTIKRGVS